MRCTCKHKFEGYYIHHMIDHVKLQQIFLSRSNINLKFDIDKHESNTQHTILQLHLHPACFRKDMWYNIQVTLRQGNWYVMK